MGGCLGGWVVTRVLWAAWVGQGQTPPALSAQLLPGHLHCSPLLFLNSLVACRHHRGRGRGVAHRRRAGAGGGAWPGAAHV